jgi:hypothetical protein
MKHSLKSITFIISLLVIGSCDVVQLDDKAKSARARTSLSYVTDKNITNWKTADPLRFFNGDVLTENGDDWGKKKPSSLNTIASRIRNSSNFSERFSLISNSADTNNNDVVKANFCLIKQNSDYIEDDAPITITEDIRKELLNSLVGPFIKDKMSVFRLEGGDEGEGPTTNFFDEDYVLSIDKATWWSTQDPTDSDMRDQVLETIKSIQRQGYMSYRRLEEILDGYPELLDANAWNNIRPSYNNARTWDYLLEEDVPSHHGYSGQYNVRMDGSGKWEDRGHYDFRKVPRLDFLAWLATDAICTLKTDTTAKNEGEDCTSATCTDGLVCARNYGDKNQFRDEVLAILSIVPTASGQDCGSSTDTEYINQVGIHKSVSDSIFVRDEDDNETMQEEVYCSLPKKCYRPLSEGSECTYNPVCEDGLRCSQVTNGFPYGSDNFRKIGDSCTGTLEDNNCDSGRCENGVCVEYKKCLSCAQYGSIPEEGQVCCDGFVKDVDYTDELGVVHTGSNTCVQVVPPNITFNEKVLEDEDALFALTPYQESTEAFNINSCHFDWVGDHLYRIQSKKETFNNFMAMLAFDFANQGSDYVDDTWGVNEIYHKIAKRRIALRRILIKTLELDLISTIPDIVLEGQEAKAFNGELLSTKAVQAQNKMQNNQNTINELLQTYDDIFTEEEIESLKTHYNSLLSIRQGITDLCRFNMYLSKTSDVNVNKNLQPFPEDQLEVYGATKNTSKNKYTFTLQENIASELAQYEQALYALNIVTNQVSLEALKKVLLDTQWRKKDRYLSNTTFFLSSIPIETGYITDKNHLISPGTKTLWSGTSTPKHYINKQLSSGKFRRNTKWPQSDCEDGNQVSSNKSACIKNILLVDYASQDIGITPAIWEDESANFMIDPSLPYGITKDELFEKDNKMQSDFRNLINDEANTLKDIILATKNTNGISDRLARTAFPKLHEADGNYNLHAQYGNNPNKSIKDHIEERALSFAYNELGVKIGTSCRSFIKYKNGSATQVSSYCNDQDLENNLKKWAKYAYDFHFVFPRLSAAPGDAGYPLRGQVPYLKVIMESLSLSATAIEGTIDYLAKSGGVILNEGLSAQNATQSNGNQGGDISQNDVNAKSINFEISTELNSNNDFDNEAYLKGQALTLGRVNNSDALETNNKSSISLGNTNSGSLKSIKSGSFAFTSSKDRFKRSSALYLKNRRIFNKSRSLSQSRDKNNFNNSINNKNKENSMKFYTSLMENFLAPAKSKTLEDFSSGNNKTSNINYAKINNNKESKNKKSSRSSRYSPLNSHKSKIRSTQYSTATNNQDSRSQRMNTRTAPEEDSNNDTFEDSEDVIISMRKQMGGQVNKDRQSSLFRQISARYAKSGIKRLLDF